MLLIAPKTVLRVDLKQYRRVKESAPNSQLQTKQLLVPEAVRKSLSITKRDITI